VSFIIAVQLKNTQKQDTSKLRIAQNEIAAEYYVRSVSY